MKRRIFRYFLCLGCLYLLQGDLLATDLIDELEGVYIVPGKATAQKKIDGPFSKVKGATDCLVIRRRSDHKAEVYLSSIQERGYSCYLEGEVVIDGNRLFYADPDAVDSKREGVYIGSSDGKIRFTYVPRPTSHYCGIHADLRSVAFEMDKKSIPWRSEPSIKKESLSEYCPAWNR